MSISIKRRLLRIFIVGMIIAILLIIRVGWLQFVSGTELQTMAFMIQEMALYLDTHRDDQEALEVYQNFQRMYQQGRETYEKECGPLNHMSMTNGAYKWLDDPWPWEYAKNREV